ncbi:MAG: hypothetical protein OEY14_18645, partial [Myxococcales bacterium]|nr:hypothetical protein [Myxococcales bacterium]
VQAEYRFPIVRAQRGLLTLPFYVRRLYASVFADFGDAFYGDLDLERFRWGFGAELFVDLTLGYHVNLSLRTGLAYGPNDGGGLQWYSHLGLPF